MSRALATVVPEALQRELDGDPASDDGLTLLVITSGGRWPHLAMVSRGEIVCRGERLLRLALWPTSTACANLRERPDATICAVLDGVSYSLRVSAVRLPDIATPLAGTLACFELTLESVLADEAPYAVLESGVRFRLTDPGATLARWREVRATLAGEPA